MQDPQQTAPKILEDAKRIVIKIGTESIISNGKVDTLWLLALAADVAVLKSQGKQVFIVSSGAIGLGRGSLNIHPDIPTKDLPLRVQQVASCEGQPLLMDAYRDSLGQFGLRAPQILLTRDMVDNPQQVQNLLNVLLNHDDDVLPSMRSGVPIINENDALATEDITFGDNDGLAAIVAKLVGADALVLLSKETGLYTDNPNKNADAKFLPYVPDVRRAFEFAHDDLNGFSRGGMNSKLKAAQMATDAGIPVILARGMGVSHAVGQLMDAQSGFQSTVFAPH